MSLQAISPSPFLEVIEASKKDPKHLNGIVQIFQKSCQTINDFYTLSRVCKSFRQFVQHPDVMRALFSRSIFDLVPKRYPLPPSCPSGRVVAHAQNLSPQQFSELMDSIHKELRNFVSATSRSLNDVKCTEHPHLYIDDLVADVIRFMGRHARHVKDLTVFLRCENFFILDQNLNRLLSTVEGMRELYIGDYIPTGGLTELPTDRLEGLTDEGFVNIGSQTELRALTINTRCNAITKETFQRLQGCSKLEKFSLQSYRRTHTLYEAMQESVTLSEADMEKIAKLYRFDPMYAKPGEKPDFLAGASRSAPSFPNLPILRTLKILKMPHAKDAFWQVTKSTRLFTVYRYDKTQTVGLKNDELVELGKLSSLIELRLSLYNATSGIAALANLQKLQKLSLVNHASDNWILQDDLLFQTLAKIQALQYLYLERINVTKENSFNAMISSLAKLETLYIREVNLALSDLASLALHPSLKQVTLLGLYFRKDALKAHMNILELLACAPVLQTVVFDLYNADCDLEHVHEFLLKIASSRSLQSVTFKNVKKDQNSYTRQSITFTRNADGKFA